MTKRRKLQSPVNMTPENIVMRTKSALYRSRVVTFTKEQYDNMAARMATDIDWLIKQLAESTAKLDKLDRSAPLDALTDSELHELACALTARCEHLTERLVYSDHPRWQNALATCKGLREMVQVTQRNRRSFTLKFDTLPNHDSNTDSSGVHSR